VATLSSVVKCQDSKGVKVVPLLTASQPTYRPPYAAMLVFFVLEQSSFAHFGSSQPLRQQRRESRVATVFGKASNRNSCPSMFPTTVSSVASPWTPWTRCMMQKSQYFTSASTNRNRKLMPHHNLGPECRDFTHHDTLDSFRFFYVNKFADHHAHEIAR
jgi:hypothetical protein